MSVSYHEVRLENDPKRAVVWKALWRYYFSRRVGADETVLDLGCGYGDFINNVRVRRRLALDAWPDFVRHLEPGVEAIVAQLEGRGEAPSAAQPAAPSSSGGRASAIPRTANSGSSRPGARRSPAAGPS